MVTIVFDQPLSNSAMYEHRCLESIKKLYKSSGKCNDQQHYNSIIKASMVTTTKELTENSPMSLRKSVTVKNPSARKSLHQFLDTLKFKPKTTVHRFCAAK